MDVTIPRAALEGAELPPVCVRTGAPADRYVLARRGRRDPAVFLPAAGDVAEAVDAARRMRYAGNGIVAALLAFIGLLAFTALREAGSVLDPAVAAMAAAGAAGGAVLGVLGRRRERRAWVDVGGDGATVVVGRAHPDFADAVAGWLTRSPEPPPPEPGPAPPPGTGAG